jgi:hypothetical protein
VQGTLNVLDYVLVGVKSCPASRHAGANGERMYSSYSLLTSVIEGVSG